MTATGWENLYQDAYNRGLEAIRGLKGVACAFHSVIDGTIRLTPDVIQPVLDEKPFLKKAALAGCRGEAPLEINTPEDFIQGMFYSLKRGAAMQRMIRSEETYRWALETFGSGKLRLGGTSANMARSLAPLDIPVTVYANPLTEDLAGLFGEFEHLHVIQKTAQGYRLQSPQAAAEEKGVFAIHWIFEYGTDFYLELDGEVINPHRANRYIPSWNPRNNQFKMDPDFAEGFLSLAESYSHLLFSGFHILSETYPDGSTCDDVVRPLGEFLHAVRQQAPHIRVHLEMASIASTKVRQAVLEQVVPYIHSMGLNETELPLLLENLGDQSMAESLRGEPDVEDYLRACALLVERTHLPRLHFHNLGYYLCLEQKPWENAQDCRDALLFAAVMAAARAQNGLFTQVEDIAAGKEPPVAQAGIQALQKVSEFIGDTEFKHTGMGTYQGLTLAMAPTKVVKNPLFTVGLGDTISAGAFLTE